MKKEKGRERGCMYMMGEGKGVDCSLYCATYTCKYEYWLRNEHVEGLHVPHDEGTLLTRKSRSDLLVVWKHTCLREDFTSIHCRGQSTMQCT